MALRNTCITGALGPGIVTCQRSVDLEARMGLGRAPFENNQSLRPPIYICADICLHRRYIIIVNKFIV